MSDVEHILCDTSFVSVQQAATNKPELVAHWASDITDRLDAAVLAIAVFTLAELRAGHIHAGWGAKTRADAEKVIAGYVLVPLDMDIVDRFAHLHATLERKGRTLNHNDLWIASTALARGWPLVSCDKHFNAVPDLEHIHLPKTPESRV